MDVGFKSTVCIFTRRNSGMWADGSIYQIIYTRVGVYVISTCELLYGELCRPAERHMVEHYVKKKVNMFAHEYCKNEGALNGKSHARMMDNLESLCCL